MAKRDPSVVSYTMSHIRSKNTGLELSLRKALSQRGVSYRLYSSKVYGHPDICIKKLRIAIFCDSEFWHGYHFEDNQEKIRSNRDYWIPKIKRNIARDQEVNVKLKEEGYLVLRYWGKEIEKELDRVVDEILFHIGIRERILSLSENISVFTTLAYIEKEGSYLMLHRVKKKNDVNEGKWIGVGGKLEAGESMVQALKREIEEETGLLVSDYSYYGKIDFLNDAYPPERMYLFKVSGFSGALKECDEGDLAWVKKEDVLKLPLWDGDKTFLPLLDKENTSPFRLALLYEKNELRYVFGPYRERREQKKKKTKKCLARKKVGD